jgi:beta-barrel assembly-enhancing protease
VRRRIGSCERVVAWVGTLSLLAGCATQGRGLDAQTIRERAEKEEAALLKRVRVYEEPGLVEYLAGVAQRLVGDAARVRITVIADPTLAAFAMPGGRVFVHTGWLSRVESEGQLAAILARELAHDTSKLAERSFKGPLPRTLLSPTAAAVLGLDLKLMTNAAIEGYGPDEERAADVAGAHWLAAAGYDRGEALKVFELLARDGADRDGLLEIFFYGNRSRMDERYEAARELPGQIGAAQGIGSHGAGAGELARRMRPVVRDNAALDMRAGRFALAQRQLDRVLEVAPDDPIAQVYYGDVYRLQSQQASGPARAEGARKALERYERAVALDPSFAEAFRQLALLHYQERDTAKARAAFERYLSLKPDAPDAQRVREYLAALRD